MVNTQQTGQGKRLTRSRRPRQERGEAQSHRACCHVVPGASELNLTMGHLGAKMVLPFQDPPSGVVAAGGPESVCWDS